MNGLDILKKTISLEDLQRRTASIIDEVSGQQKEKIVIHNNQIKAVVISAEMYDSYLKKMSNAPQTGNTGGSSAFPTSNNRNHNPNIPKFKYDMTRSANDIARDAFDYFEKYEILTNEQLYNLGNGLYCSDTFGLSYPLVKMIHNKILLTTEIVIDNQVRYWKQLYTFNGKYYVLYSLLYDKQKIPLTQWIDNVLGYNQD